MNKRIPFFVLIFAAAGLFPQNKPAGPEPDDFAGNISLSGTAGRLLSLEIPEEVYRGLRRADMADMRVFDAEGLPVPFTVRPVPGQVFTPPPRTIPFFIWEKETALPAGADIEIDASGTVIRINSRGGPSTGRTNAAYLLDLSGFPGVPSALVLSMENKDHYNSAVRIYSGTDLSFWSEFDRRQIIAWYGDSGANRDTIELPERDMRYLLLKFENPAPAPRSITALWKPVQAPPPRREKAAAGTFPDAGRRIVNYDTGGFYPIVSVNFILPETDSVETLIKSRNAIEDEWRAVARAALFRFSGPGGEKTHEALEISSSARYWELESLSLPFAKAPEGRFGWQIREIVFPGRGKGPWTLAYGNPGCGPPEEFTVPAGVFMEKAAAGEIVYRPPEEEIKFPRRWGQFLLWSILAAAAIILTGLAFYIAKIIKKEDVS
ncbi:MAG: DUF3999 domain-containing protein [Treponema sp.]|jgi:hypothetical protein|nr:DUF3999 domain-containing protein [Treponema sp.]